MLGTGIALSLLAFFIARGWQQSDVNKRAAELTHHYVEKLQLSLLRSMEVLNSIEALESVEGRVTRETFREFVQGALKRQPELQALSWNPVVPYAERERFESQAEASGLEGFLIREQSTAGQLVSAGFNEAYVPILWIEPLAGNVSALGFDLSSDVRRRECLDHARDSGRATATSPIRLAQSDNHAGFLVLKPVYRKGLIAESVDARRSNLVGYAVAVFSVSNLVAGVMTELNQKGIDAWLLDDSAHGEMIYGKPGAGGERAAARLLNSPTPKLLNSLTLDVAGRRWVLRYMPTREFASATSGWQMYLILGAGLAFTLLTSAYLYGGWRSSAELAKANDALRQEVIVRERAESAAASANAAKSDFLASMSHEIRTPLNAILGYAQLMHRDAHLSPEQRDLLDGITVGGQHLLSLINEILDLSKIEAGRAELNANDFDLKMLARSLETTFKPLCAQKRIEFQAHIDLPARTRVRGDEGKLRQVLINLIGNAVKFTQSGEVRLNIHAVDACWLFDVTDTGLGIPREEQADIFKPFHQGSGAQHQGGTGLGLAIAQRQVALLGGELKLESDRGAGSRFFFGIPLEAPKCEEAAEAPAIARLRHGDRVSALIVDDRKENCDVMGGMLLSIGCDVTCASNAEEALATMRNSSPGIIFLDWFIPGTSGAALTQQLRSTTTRSVPVIAHSASTLPRHRDEALNAGCVDFISKPFRCERIYAALQQHLGVEFEYEPKTEARSLPPLEHLRVHLPEELAARLSVAAELHSSTALKSALLELRQMGPDAGALAERIRDFMRSYDMDAIQRLLANTVTRHTSGPCSLLPASYASPA